MANQTPEGHFEYPDLDDPRWYEQGRTITVDGVTETQSHDGIVDWLEQHELRHVGIVQSWSDLPANDPDKTDDRTGNERVYLVRDDDVLARDTGTDWRIIAGRGSASRNIPEQHVDLLHAQRATGNPDHYDYANEDAPINIGVNSNSRAINIQSQTDSQASGSFGNIYWISDAGERFATVVGNTNDPTPDIAIYTKSDALGSGDTGLKNRFQIHAGSDQTNADFRNLNVLEFYGDGPNLEFKPEVAGEDTRIWFNSTDGREHVIRRVDSDNSLRLTTLTGSGDSITINPDASVSFNSNLLKDPATEGSSTDPRADTTADDYLHVEIGGTLHYIPLYT